MTFPVGTPSDGDKHTEDGIDFYGVGGRWRRRDYMEPHAFGDGIASSRASFKGTIPSGKMHQAYNAIEMQAGFVTAADTYVRCSIWSNGRELTSNQYVDFQGKVTWGNGAYFSRDWDQSSWGGTGFRLAIEDNTRVIKYGTQQRLELSLSKAGDSDIRLFYTFYSPCISGNILIVNYVMGQIEGVALETIDGFTLTCRSPALFTDGRMNIEVY